MYIFMNKIRYSKEATKGKRNSDTKVTTNE